MAHLDTERLQEYADGRIAEGDRSVVDSHLQSCSRCAGEVAEWRSLFTTLAALPQLEPRTGFASRVMARVQVRALPVWAPWLSQAQALAERIAPKSSAGWAFAVAMLALPVLLGGGALAWLLSHDYVTTESLQALLTERATSSLQSLGASALSSIMQTQVASWLVQQAGTIVATTGLRGLGLLAAICAALTLLSLWILYKNLFRTPTREPNYVSFSF